LGESRANNSGGFFSQKKLLNLLRGEPLRIRGVGAGPQFPRQRLAKKIDEHVVIENVPLGIGNDAVEYAQQFGRADNQAGFFQSLAFCALAQGLAKLQHPARDRPLSEKRGFAAFNQYDAASLNDQGANSDQRLFWVFALQVVVRLSAG